ncbi:1-acyl-sn-glycerol-3-phosphate acyltransferase [Geobacter sulfurreducens]|uniref:1-acyl-sn-glycerol-3-phosphate acyltransferase n=1 Tax=Geobacter sulfurreducens (strain ATCC 51573 / DSM 12127 / PCA) TaxID=243231 RepID=Q747Z9_GEOSL|nr:lysophospholipid acyltransferase family protein [Geobacter sulfurreducens]BET59491.1 lysophospholipid acyltransferase family protein [Geobacter sp. 60473]AAR36507.1 [acyl-]glycerolphosphate acyltransferase [Geobacter sulfurreducens PCA]QVW34910.1 1-acyl-sn-glycerol-3-phosphate acyltransferase [Geobacter sulfurreducens]UAC03781.1 1-acyl-sn-glycerol-3-phosphate acyltransferase [Geobacter sulfurreducens]BEH11635.1 lysophospholipid acyltransferase family protein [Geobacter sulfurreducens subsp.
MLNGLIYLAFFIPLSGFFSFAALVGSLVDASGGFAHRCALAWSRIGLMMAGVRLDVSGTENVPAGEPVIFMGNHQGNFDILVLSRAIPRRFSWLAKEELFRIPLFGAAMQRAGYIPVDRSDGRKALRSLDAAAKRIRAGASVIVFPEGTRTADGSLLPFKKGGFVLAERAGVPIIPFTINGSMQVNPRNTVKLVRGARIAVRFGTPIPTSGAGALKGTPLMEQVRSAIQSGLEG